MGPLLITLIVAAVIVLIVVIVIIYRYSKFKSSQEPMLISRPKLMTRVKTIPGDKLPLSSTGQEYTYSFWIFVRDWDVTPGGKCILHRSNGDLDFKVASPSVWFYPKENHLMVRISTKPSEGSSNLDAQTYFPYERSASGYTDVNPGHYSGSGPDPTIWNTNYACDVANIPIQRWVHISIVVWNRTLDVYVNGKVARSAILPGVPVHDASELSKLSIGKGNTFNGYISRLKYFNRATTSQEVLSIYKKGPLPANWWWQNLKNRIKIILEIDSDT